MKLPDDGSDETKHGARCCVALQGGGGRYTFLCFKSAYIFIERPGKMLRLHARRQPSFHLYTDCSLGTLVEDTARKTDGIYFGS